MILLNPAAAGIFRTEEHQHRGFKLRHFVLAQGFAGETTRQNTVQLSFTGFREQHYVQRVVRHFTAVCGKVIQTFGQRGLQIAKATNVGIRNFRQLRHVVVKGRQLDVEGFIRAPAWQHFDVKRAVLRDNRVMFQRVDRIVGGAHHLHVHLLHDAARREAILRQQFVALIPDFIRRGGREQLAGDTKRTTQFEVRPVV